jgi:transcriptional regulator with XRE-family HTH domain
VAVERDFEPSRIGGKLREQRERRGITLRELARRVGVSPSLVSQIELDRVNPSVSTLWAIVTELGMTMSDVFGETPQEPAQVQPARGENGLVALPDTRRVINLASGVRWERLTPHSDPDVEFLYVVYPVGAESSPEDALVTHGGREYGYVTSGTLGVRVPARRSSSTRPRRTAYGRLATSPSTRSGSSSGAPAIRAPRSRAARARPSSSGAW